MEGLPPLILELKAQAGDLYTKLGEAKGEIASFAKDAEGSGSIGTRALNGMATVGKTALLGLGAAAVGVGGVSVRMAGDFQESMTQLVTGAGESKSNIDTVSSGILAMSGDVGVSATKIAEGMFMVESAGYHGADGLAVMKAAAEGAKVGGADMGATADAVTTILKDYGMTSAQAGDAMNTLTATVSNGKTHMQDLAGSLSTVLPLASALHVPLNDAMGAMATMTARGIDAATASTNLKFTMMALARETPKGAKELSLIGLSSKDVAESLGKNGLQKTLEMVTDHLKTKFPEGSAGYNAALANIVGGTRGMGAALSLTGANMADYKNNIVAVTSTVKEGKGEIVGWSETQEDFNVRLDKAKAAAEALGIKLGTWLIPKLEDLMDKTQAAIGWLEHHKTEAQILGGVVGGFLVTAITVYIGSLVAAGVRSALTFGGMVLDGVKWAASLAGRLYASVGLHVWYWGTTAAGWIAERAKWLAGEAADGARWLATKAVQYGSAVAGAVGAAASTTAAWVASGAATLADNVATGAVWVAGKIAQFVVVSATAIASAAASAAAWIAANLAMIVASGGILLLVGLLVAGALYLKDHWREVWAAIKGFVSGAWEWIKTHIGLILTIALGPLGLAISFLGQHWGEIWGGIQRVVADVWNFIQPIFARIGDAIGTIVHGVQLMAGGIGGALHTLGIPGFAEGGPTPGAIGQPSLAVVHGGEYVLSADMRAGRAPAPGAFTGSASQMPNASQGQGSTTNITVNATTNANPRQIAAEVGWQLRHAS